MSSTTTVKLYVGLPFDLAIIKIRDYKKNSGVSNFHREMNVNNFKINFDKFDDLHLANYRSIINKKKFRIKEFYNLLKNIEKLKL